MNGATFLQIDCYFNAPYMLGFNIPVIILTCDLLMPTCKKVILTYIYLKSNIVINITITLAHIGI